MGRPAISRRVHYSGPCAVLHIRAATTNVHPLVNRHRERYRGQLRVGPDTHIVQRLASTTKPAPDRGISGLSSAHSPADRWLLDRAAGGLAFGVRCLYFDDELTVLFEAPVEKVRGDGVEFDLRSGEHDEGLGLIG